MEGTDEDHRTGVPSGAAPPTGPAVEHPPTRRALARYRWVPPALLGAAVPCTLIALGLAALGASGPVWLLPLAPAGASLAMAVQRTVRVLWLHRVLRRQPWVLRSARHHRVGSGEYTWGVVVLAADEHGPEVMATVQGPWARSLSIVDGPIPVWVAGDRPRRTATVRWTP